MHRDVPVTELELNELSSVINIGKPVNPEHMPFGTFSKSGVVPKAFARWWAGRSIPDDRDGIDEFFAQTGISSKELALKCFGLSLTDHYWIKPRDSEIRWKDINFFDNAFSGDIGNMLFGGKSGDSIDFISPDSTSDGQLKKKWTICGDDRMLIKCGRAPYKQEPFNEVIASRIGALLGIWHTEYTLAEQDSEPCCLCRDFIDGNTELVPAWRIIQTKKQPNSKSMYQHFVDCADALGIPNVREFLDQMIVIDYIITNEDRHLNNFGAIRNAETLEWLGMAPIYDSGSSLGYDKSVPMMRDGSEVVCKPFKKHHEEQLKLVSSFDWINFSALTGVGEMITEILSDENAKDYMEENRIRVIAELTERRIKNLEALANSKTHKQTITTDDEVGQNIAASYEDKK